MKRPLALCSVVSLALCGTALAQSGEREPARTPASASAAQGVSKRCDRLTGAERRQCLKERPNTARKPRPADQHSGAGSSAPGGRADGQPGSYGARAPAKSGD